MSLFAYKEFVIADGEIILSVLDEYLPGKISSQNDTNMVSISTPDLPTGGTFECFAELVENGGFHGVLKIQGDTNSIDATKIGAQVADGEAEAFSFKGSPYRIKVKAVGVTGVTSVNVVITQNVG